jgi:hypothetical protein
MQNIAIRSGVFFVGAFAKLLEATISFVMFFLSIRPSVLMEQFSSHWTDFNEILYLSIV